MKRLICRIATCGLFAAVIGGAAIGRAEGFKLWRPFAKKETVTISDGGIGGTPYADASRENAADASGPSFGSTVSGALSNVGSATKKGWNKTVDVVTLKSLRSPKPAPSQFRLGAHPDPRSQPKKSGGLLGSVFGKSEASRQPATVGEFFSQERP